MSDAGGESATEKELRKDNLRLARRVRQLERMTQNSEVVAKQSQGAYRRTVEDLKGRTKELEAATRQALSLIHISEPTRPY